jgi:acetyltransferase
VRAIVEDARREGRNWLDPLETDAVLTAYDNPVGSASQAPQDPDAAADAAREFIAQGQPVALKILSRDIQHKSDVDGVRLNLTGETDVRAAATGRDRQCAAAETEGSH